MGEDNFNRIYYQYRDMVMSIAYDMLKDSYLAQDVCQEVFLQLSDTKKIELTVSKKTKNYLGVVAYHRSIDCYRKRKRLKEVTLEESEWILDSSIEERIERDNILGEILKDLRDNHPQWYDVIIHIDLYEESGKEAARELGISVTSLRTRYHRAKKWLADKYGPDTYYNYFEA